MKKINWQNATFVKSVPANPKDYPILKNDQGEILPEVAVAGRSNVGKSSLLNHLFRTKNLMRTSSTPGKTQLLNFINVDKKLAFVDLPGYGYAQVPLEVREKWGPAIQTYLKKRAELQLILFLFDIRRTPQTEDIEFMEWMAKAEKGVILILTKVDKVSKNELSSQTAKILEEFKVPNLHYIPYSVTQNIGRDALEHMIQDAFK